MVLRCFNKSRYFEQTGQDMRTRTMGNSLDQLRHPRTDAYSAEQVLLNKQHIWGVELVWTVTPTITDY